MFFFYNSGSFQICISSLQYKLVIKEFETVINNVKTGIMKRLMIFTLSIFALIFTAKASEDKPITFEQLPQAAQQFIKSHFPDRTISLAKVDSDIIGRSYDVIFSNGDKLEFDSKGKWISVECGYSVVPNAVVPAQILEYVKKNYPDTTIKKIDREDRGAYDVELSNKLDLTFNSSFKLVDIDS